MFVKVLKKLGSYILVLIGLSILVFIIARVIPGDPARQALGPNVSEETVQALRVKMNLDKPLPVQYYLWLKGAVQLDLGASLLTRRPVIQDIRQYLPATLEIVLLSAVFMVETASTTELFRQQLHPYTVALMRCIPRLSGGGVAEGISGRIPNYLDPPAGCRFAPRCPMANKRCFREKPGFYDQGDGHCVACFLYEKEGGC